MYWIYILFLYSCGILVGGWSLIKVITPREDFKNVQQHVQWSCSHETISEQWAEEMKKPAVFSRSFQLWTLFSTIELSSLGTLMIFRLGFRSFIQRDNRNCFSRRTGASMTVLAFLLLPWFSLLHYRQEWIFHQSQNKSTCPQLWPSYHGQTRMYWLQTYQV